MAVIHISEADAAREFSTLLARVRAGEQVVIEDDMLPVAVLQPASNPHLRLLSESLRLAKEDGLERCDHPMTRLNRFSESSISSRRIQAWLILTAKARNRQTVTYAELAELMLGEKSATFGKRAPQWKGLSLGHLYTYCKRNRLPLLPVIVVAKETGEPVPLGELYEDRPVGVERERVFDFDWYDLLPPTEEDFND